MTLIEVLVSTGLLVGGGGALVGRDDGLMLLSNLTLNHDLRLNMSATNPAIWLPVDLERPAMVRWRRCTTPTCE